MTTGGDVCKAFASGADAVMIGSAFARAVEAPGRGYHWGMATPHANLPRGTRIRVGIAGSLEQILFGPAFTEDGTLNLVGAIRTCMGSVGARTIRELQQTELIIAPTINALTGFEGIPRVSKGIKDVCAPALFADSGAATPSMAPLPNWARFLEIFFSIE